MLFVDKGIFESKQMVVVVLVVLAVELCDLDISKKKKKKKPPQNMVTRGTTVGDTPSPGPKLPSYSG